MKVGLWAEIRRLKEIEKLSHRAIARRLGCCAKTVKKALALERPPDRQSKPASGQPVGSVQAADRRLVGPHAGVVGRPRAGGDSPWRAGLSGRHLAGAAVPPASPSAAGPDLSRSGLATRRGPASGLGRVWPDPPGQHLAAGLRLRGGACVTAACATSNSPWPSARPTSTGPWCMPWSSSAALRGR